MHKNILVLSVFILTINFVTSIYTREELTTKPPFTIKSWRKPALQPSELNHHSLANNSQVIVHHNYSRVLVLKPKETILTEIKQIKNTYSPENEGSSNPQTSEVEEIWSKPQKYSQNTQNWDQIEQSNIGVSDKLDWEETSSTNWEQRQVNSGTNNKLNWEQSETKCEQPNCGTREDSSRKLVGTSSKLNWGESVTGISSGQTSTYQNIGINPGQTSTYQNIGTNFEDQSQTGTNTKLNWGQTSSGQTSTYQNIGQSQIGTNQGQPTARCEQPNCNTGPTNKLNWGQSNAGTSSGQSSTYQNTRQSETGTNLGQNIQEQTDRRPKGHYIVHEQNYQQNLGPKQNYQQNFGPQTPYKLEYKPKDTYNSKNSKKYRNMAFETCPKNSTGPIAYLWSCKQYLNCWKGRGFVQNCAAGTNFNPETLECDFPHKVKCISGVRDQKVKFEKYSNIGDDISKICGPGFSGLLPHPTDCTKFVNCASGQTFIQDCGPGTAFNSVIQACDFPDKVGCQINNQQTDNYELQESEIRSFINPNLNYDFQPGSQYLDQNYNEGSVIRVYDNNLLSYGQNSGQNCAPNCPTIQPTQNCGHGGCIYPGQNTQTHNAGQNTQFGAGYDQTGQNYEPGQYDQNVGQNIGHDSQQFGTNYEQNRRNCPNNNCGHSPIPGQTYNQQGWNTNGQNYNQGTQKCPNNNCGPAQLPGQTYDPNYQRPNCPGNNCSPTQVPQGQNNDQHGINTRKCPNNNCGSYGTPIHNPDPNSWNYQKPNCANNNCSPPRASGQNCPNNNCGQSRTGQDYNPQVVNGQNYGQYDHGIGQICASGNCGNIPNSGGQIGQNCEGQNCGTGDQTGTQFTSTYSGQTGQDCGSNICPPPSNLCNPNDKNCLGQNTNRDSHRLNLTTTYWVNNNDDNNRGQYHQNFDQSQQGTTGYGQIHSPPNTHGQNSGYYLHSRPNEQLVSSGRYTQTSGQYLAQASNQNGQNILTGNRNTVPKCPSGHTGLLPHPTICAKFLNCANGQTFVQDCGPGTVFNPKISTCDWPKNVDCPTVDGKREISQNPPGPQSGTNINSGQNYGRRNTTSYAQNLGHNYGQNSGLTQQRNFTRYGHNIGTNVNYNSGQNHGQNIGRNTTNYAQNLGYNYGQNNGISQQRNFTRYDYNIGTNTNYNSGQYYGQNIHRNSTNYGGNTGQGFGQNQGPNSGQSYPQYTPNLGLNNTNNGGTYNNQYYGQSNVRNSTQIGQNRQTTSDSLGQQNRPYFSSQTGQNIPCANCGANNNNKPQGPKFGGPINQNLEQYRNNNKTGTNRNNFGTKGYTGVIGYRRDPPVTHDIIEPVAPTQLNYNINVTQNPKRTGKHWPPPFPSTDTSADYYFEETTESSTTNNDRKVWKHSKTCSESEFECSKNECIPEILRCNGKEDCANGSDERNCEIYTKHFTLIRNSRLYRHEVEKWLNTDLETCAKYCLNSKNFECKSFNYRNETKVCMLCDSNVGLSGALAQSHFYDYYEITAKAIDCTNMYLCSNKKCINYSQICDGNDDCGNREDEKQCLAHSIGYEIKLAGSHLKNEGRIEVKVFDEWGYICDDKFGLRNADVVCKELGFKEGALEVKSGSFFARDVKDNETFYLMDDVQCFGNETTIRDCDFNGWGIHNCMPQEIVGIVCKTSEEVCQPETWKCDTTKECLPLQFLCDGVVDCFDRSDEGIQHCGAPIEVRLMNGTSRFEGRVEIRYHGVWGTICDDDFNDMTAKVVCNSLGFYGSAVAKKDGAFGGGSGPIWLDQLNCFGNESVLQECAHWNWGEHNCDHSEDAGVVCSYADISEYEKRSKDDTSISITPFKPDLDDTLFEGKCGFRGDDLFNGESNENSDIHFRVVKGSIARKGDYPWQATIRVKGLLKSAHWCGAVVISNKYVLTAAHCLVGFAKGSYMIRAGDYNIDEVENSESEAYIEDFFVHERFRQGGQMNNDIALIKLKGSGLKLSKQIQPICLPNKNVKYRPGLNCTISGFGSTETGKSTSSRVLRAGWVKIQSDEICKMPQVYGDTITNGMFCAGSLDEGVDSCDGDSGGPLACLDNGLFTLYGITSWGQRCGHANKPGVYVKVSEYRDWIDKMIQESS